MIGQKQPSEKAVFGFNFAPLLSAATIATVDAVTISPSGQLTEGARTIASRQVNLRLDGGTDGTAYRVTVRITASDGQTFELDGTIEVAEVVAAPFTTPISLGEAKKHLRVGGTAEDQLISGAIAAARGWVEDYTSLVLTRREVTESFNAFGWQTRLRAWPIAADQPMTIVYRDRVGVEQTIADAELRGGSRPGLIYPAAGTRWPNASAIVGPIEVTFTAGFASNADIPAVLTQAMLVMLTAFYEDREGGAIFAAAERSAKSLCRRYRRRTL